MATFKIPGLGSYSDDSEDEVIPKKKVGPSRKVKLFLSLFTLLFSALFSHRAEIVNS